MIKYCLPLLLIVSVVTFKLSDNCQPLIFETLPDYQTSNTQLQEFSNLKLHLSDNNISKGVFPNIHRYSVNTIVASTKYDEARTTITEQGNGSFSVVSSIDYTYQYLANKTSGVKGHYHGKATASLNNIGITYLKQFTSLDSKAGFFITEIKHELTEDLKINDDYNPSADNSDKQQFNGLISTVKDQTDVLLQATLQGQLNRIISRKALNNFFGSNLYRYNYQGNSIPINSKIITFVDNTPGATIGYNGTVGTQNQCNKFVPSKSDKHTIYYSQVFIRQFVKQHINSSLWNPLLTDKNSKTKIFLFAVIDLVQIIPSVSSKFSNLKDSIYTTCKPKDYNESTLQLQQNGIQTKINWDCKVHHELTSTHIFSFETQLKYQISIQYANRQIMTNIKNALVTNIILKPLQQFPMKNSDLAQIYIKNIAQNFKGAASIGHGLVTPQFKNGVLEIKETYIQIQEN